MVAGARVGHAHPLPTRLRTQWPPSPLHLVQPIDDSHERVLPPYFAPLWSSGAPSHHRADACSSVVLAKRVLHIDLQAFFALAAMCVSRQGKLHTVIAPLVERTSRKVSLAANIYVTTRASTLVRTILCVPCLKIARNGSLDAKFAVSTVYSGGI